MANQLPEKVDRPSCQAFQLNGGGSAILAINSGHRHLYLGELDHSNNLRWKRLENEMGEKRDGPSIVNLNGGAYVFGGEEGIVERIEPVMSGVSVASMPKKLAEPRAFSGAVAVPMSFCTT